MIQIKLVQNGYLVRTQTHPEEKPEEHVFERNPSDKYVDIDEGIVNMLWHILEGFAGEIGSKYTKHRIILKIQKNDDNRWEELEKLLTVKKVLNKPTDDLIHEIWDIMEGE